MANHIAGFHFGKTEIFLQKGLDKPKFDGGSDLPVGRGPIYSLVATGAGAAGSGSSIASCASHEEIAPGKKPTSP
jgi:hypothetical protein